MRPHCDRENQIELFMDYAPHLSEHAPKLGLPIQKSNTIDIKRAASILHVSNRTVCRMCERGLLRSFRMDRRNWQIEYTSVAEYCDQLRVKFAISDARVGLRPGQKRRRDEDLLPFPWRETIFITDAHRRLECSDNFVLQLIESGELTAYQVHSNQAAWRIHEPSLDRYIAKLHAMTSRTPATPTPSSVRTPAK